jgi:phosphate transport system substrate-binding protein
MFKSRPPSWRLLALAAATLLCAPAFAGEPEVSGTGATFPAKVYQQWAERYAHDTGTKVSYAPRGSSFGVKQIAAGAVDFGATDVPMAEGDLKKKQLFQFPTLVGGVVPVVNLPGVAPQKLQLDAAVLAAIFSGQIVRWNDQAIVALNPGLALPDLRIRRVVRADGSGTTEVFVSYLKKAAAEAAAAIEGSGTLVKWPGKVTAAEGSGKVVEAVRDLPGAIGYISSDYVAREHLSGVQLRNRHGDWVAPTVDSFAAAIRAVGLFRQSLEPTSMLDTEGVGVWPIVTATYVVVPRAPKDVDRAGRALNFFYHSFLLGDQAVAGTGFAPLPTLTQARIVALLSTFRTTDGRLVPILGQATEPVQLVATR